MTGPGSQTANAWIEAPAGSFGAVPDCSPRCSGPAPKGAGWPGSVEAGSPPWHTRSVSWLLSWLGVAVAPRGRLSDLPAARDPSSGIQDAQLIDSPPASGSPPVSRRGATRTPLRGSGLPRVGSCPTGCGGWAAGAALNPSPLPEAPFVAAAASRARGFAPPGLQAAPSP